MTPIHPGRQAQFNTQFNRICNVFYISKNCILIKILFQALCAYFIVSLPEFKKKFLEQKWALDIRNEFQ